MSETSLILTTEEAAHLASLEARVETGLATFVDVGLALVEIRERGLYRATHRTFQAYCRQRWGMAASRARQLIGAAEVVRDLESVTTVTPASERVARCLAPLTPEQRAEVWREAVETAPGRRVTAAHVDAVKGRFIAAGTLVPAMIEQALDRAGACMSGALTYLRSLPEDVMAEDPAERDKDLALIDEAARQLEFIKELWPDDAPEDLATCVRLARKADDVAATAGEVSLRLGRRLGKLLGEIEQGLGLPPGEGYKVVNALAGLSEAEIITLWQDAHPATPEAIP